MFTAELLMDFFSSRWKEKMSNDLLLLGWIQLPLRKSHHPITWRMLANFKWDSSTVTAGEPDRWQQMGGNEQVALRIAEFGTRRLGSGGQALALELIDLSSAVRWINRTLYSEEVACMHCYELQLLEVYKDAKTHHKWSPSLPSKRSWA